MFAATTHQIVKSLGKDTLTPVRSVDCADNVAPFALVLKERRRRLIFWKRTKCLTTEFKLGDILSEPLTDEEKTQWVSSRTLASFQYETDFSLSGKLGVDLNKELLDIDLEGCDSVNVKSTLGDLTKEEVHLQNFIDGTNHRKINLKHDLVSPFLNDSSKTLCLVTGVVRLAKEASISGKCSVKGSEEIKAVGDKINEGGSAVEIKIKTLTVPANTALAYNVYELQISKQDGRFSMVLDPSQCGGFVSSLSVDLEDVDGPSDAMGATALFQGIQAMSEDDRKTLQSCTLHIVQVPKCLDPLNELLHKAADLLEMSIEKTTTWQSLCNKIPSLDSQLLQFINLAGFLEQEDGTITYPAQTTEVFEACELLISLLDDLDDDELDVVSCCLQDITFSQAVIAALQPVWESNKNEVSLEGDYSWLETGMGKKLTRVFNIEVDGDVLRISHDNLLDTQALYLIIDAFAAQETSVQ